MKFEKLFIGIFMIMILLVSPAYAGIEVLSGSKIDFESNDPDLRGEAFQILVVENGGSERLLFNDLEPETGYELEPNSGYISGSANNIRVDYPYYTRSGANSVYEIIDLGEKWFVTQSYAQAWCNDLTSRESWALKNGIQQIGTYTCYSSVKVGTIADIDLAQYKWEEDFKISNPLTGEVETMTLDSQNREGVYQYSDNKKILIKYSFSGLNVNSEIPDLDSYSIIQQNSESRIITEFDSTETDPFEPLKIMETFVDEVMGDGEYDRITEGNLNLWTMYTIKNPELVKEDINEDLSDLVDTAFISKSGWTVSEPKEISSTSGVVRLTKNDDDYPISPIFSIKLDAEWIGVYQPVGEPKLLEFEVSGTDEFVEGDPKAIIYSKVKNDAPVDASFSYTLACSPEDLVEIKSLGTYSFEAGETKTIEHQVTSSTTGKDIEAKCCLIVKDRSNPTSVSEQLCEDITFFESNTCPSGMNEGEQSCALDKSILECTENEEGRLVLQKTEIVCDYGCSLDGSFAVCKQNPTCEDEYTSDNSCGDGICESFENTGKDCSCLEDCSISGDGYCSAKEREEGTAPEDCGNPFKYETFFWIIFGIIATLSLGFATYTRLKMDGVVN